MIKKLVVDENYKTWSQRILEHLENDKWQSSKQIRIALGVKYFNKSHPRHAEFFTVSGKISNLIRSGHIIKAHAPAFLSTHKGKKVELVYKSTKKPFTAHKEFVNGNSSFYELSPNWLKCKDSKNKKNKE